MLAFDDADPALDAGMEAAATSEPSLFLVLSSGFRLSPRLGQDDSFHTQLGRIGFVVTGVDTTVGTRLPWWLAKLLNMPFQHGLPLRFVSWIAVQHLILSDESTFDFAEPDLMTEFSFFVGLAPADDVRMRLEEADQLFIGWHPFAREHSTDGLVKDLLSTRHEGSQCHNEALAMFYGLGFHFCQHLFCLADRRSSDLHQSLVIGLQLRPTPAIFRAARLALRVRLRNVSLVSSVREPSSALVRVKVRPRTRTLSANRRLSVG